MSTVAVPEFNISFKPARRQQLKAKVALFGPSGSGKTLAMMRMAIAIQNMLDPTKPIAGIDTEHERISLYAEEEEFLDAEGETRFRTYPMLPPYSPAHYLAAIAKAESLGAQVCVIDSVSHAWFGKGGVQQIVDEAAARQTGGNKWAGWSVGTPAHNSLIEGILSSQMHMVCTMRAKTEWIQVGNTPKKVGLGPVQREGIEYEFDVVLKLDLDHSAEVETSRSTKFFPPGSAVTKEQMGAPFAEQVWAWISEGAAREPAASAADVEAQSDTDKALAQALAEQQPPAPTDDDIPFGGPPPDAEPAAQPAAPETEATPPDAPAEAPTAAAEPAGEAADAAAPATEGESATPVSESSAPAATNGAEMITPATKGLITKAIKALQEKHGDWEGGTDWNSRLRANLPAQKWNTREIGNVDDLTEEEGQKLLATIAKTDESVAQRKAAAAAATNEQQTL